MRKFILSFQGDSEATPRRLVQALLTQFSGDELTLYEETEDAVVSIPIPVHPLAQVFNDLEAELAANGGIVARQYRERLQTLRVQYGC